MDISIAFELSSKNQDGNNAGLAHCHLLMNMLITTLPPEKQPHYSHIAHLTNNHITGENGRTLLVKMGGEALKMGVDTNI